MEKTIKIDDKDITFKATGGIGYRYKAQFGREYIADAMILEEFRESGKDDNDYDFTKLTLESLYNILWTMAKTADENIPPPQQWLDSFNEFPVIAIFQELSDIMSGNLKIDRKKRLGGSKDKGDKSPMSTEEFVACLIMRGFAVADFDKFTYGMLINYCNAHDRLQRIARGESVPDEEMQYKQLKSIESIVEQQFLNGEITKEKYDDYKNSLAEWERGVNMAQSIKGITVEIGGNTTGLGKALEGVNKQSRNLQSELRTVDNLLKLDPGNLTLVKQKQDILTDSISATSDKLKTLKASQSQVEEQFKKGKIGRDQYIAFQKELTNTERKLKDLEKQKDSVNKISAAFATGKEKVKEFGNNIKDKITPEPVKKVGVAFENAKKNIKDVGEALSPVKEKLEGVASAAKKVGSATAKISAAGIKTVGGAVNVAAQGFKAYALSATGAAVALGAAAIKSYGELEQNLGGSEAVFGEYAKSIQKTGEEAYKNLGVSQSDYLATANKMGALFQGTGVEQQKSLELTEKAMQRAGDMASVMGIDMQTALDSVAGAAKGNFTMMDNLGVAMNATNIEAYALSKGMNFKWNTATEAEKAEVAMQMFFENTEQYAGNFAKESTQTISGSFGMLKASVGSLVAGLGNSEADIENLVQNVIDAFSSVVDNVSPIVENVAKAFPEVINAIVKEASKMLPKIITSITTELPKAMGSFIEGFNGLILGVVGAINSSLPMVITTILPTLITGFTGLVLGLVGMVPTLLPTLVDGALVLFLGLLDGLNLVIAQLIPMLPQLITDIVDTLIVNLPAIIEGGFTLIIGLITGITDCIPTLVDKVIELIPVITTALTDNIPKLIEAGLQLIVALATGLPKAIPEIIRALPEIINCIIDTLMEQDWLQIGVDILKGIADGLIEGVKAIGDSIASVASNLVGGFKKVFGIASPSKLFKKEIGPYLAQGIGVGFEDEMVGITKDMQEAIPRSFETDINANYNGASRNNSTGMAGNSNMTNTINIFANVSNDYDIKRMIGRISTELESLKMKEFAAVGG